MNIDFHAGGIHFSESELKVYFCAILETTGDSRKVSIRHFLAHDDAKAESILEKQSVEDPETGFSKKFSNPEALKPVLNQLNMEVIDEGSLSELERD